MKNNYVKQFTNENISLTIYRIGENKKNKAINMNTCEGTNISVSKNIKIN